MRVYTDGACSGNPGPGGWAWAIDGVSLSDRQRSDERPERTHDSGGEAQTTNQRMELQAVLEAISANPGTLEIVSDSTYVVNCFRDRWYEGWIKRGWRNTAKKPVANRDIWEPLIERYLERRDEITFTWVKGHSGDRMNDVVDQLAVDACNRIKLGSNGASSDSSLIGGDRPAPWRMADAVWVIGTTEPDPDQCDELDSCVARLHPATDVAVSGLRRGTELEGAAQARRRGVRLAVVLPFEDPARMWPSADRRRFDELLAAAEWVVTLDGDPSQPGRAVDQRNDWIRANVAGAIVVGDATLAAELEVFGLSVVEIV